MKFNQPVWKVVAQLAIAKSSSGGASPTLYHFYLQNKNLAVEAAANAIFGGDDYETDDDETHSPITVA